MFERLGREFSNVIIQMAHMGEVMAGEYAIDIAKRIPNVYLDTAITSFMAVVHVLEQCPDKVFMGCDYPFYRFEMELQKQRLAADDRNDQEGMKKLLGGNKEAYQQTPSEFRKQHKNSRKQKEEEYGKVQMVYEKVEQYLERNPEQCGIDKEECVLDVLVDMQMDTEGMWDHSACLMINAGTAADLLNAGIQKQILSHQDQMGFRYVRFWDIYPQHAENGTCGSKAGLF